jgi:hypothetical protein
MKELHKELHLPSLRATYIVGLFLMPLGLSASRHRLTKLPMDAYGKKGQVM